jgi:AraC-like DNA-binding protein
LDGPAADLAVDWIVAVVRDGAAVLASGHGSHPVSVGDAVLVVPGTVVGIEPVGSVSFSVVALDGDWLDQVVFWHRRGTVTPVQHRHWSLPVWREPPVRHGSVRPDHAAVLARWLDELVRLTHPATTSPVGLVRVQALTLAILDALTVSLRLGGGFGPWSDGASRSRRGVVALRPELRAAWEALRAHPARRWTLGQLAAEAHLSPSQFGRLFVGAFGRPPIQYLKTVRVQLLANLVRTTTEPVADCARLAGWMDAAYASRQFRQVTGMSPVRYRALPVPGLGFTRPR